MSGNGGGTGVGVIESLFFTFSTQFFSLFVPRPPKPVIDPHVLGCPVTVWEDWRPCQGSCLDNMIYGHQVRYRYFVVGEDFEEEFDDKEIGILADDCASQVHIYEVRKCKTPCILDGGGESPEKLHAAAQQRRVVQRLALNPRRRRR